MCAWPGQYILPLEMRKVTWTWNMSYTTFAFISSEGFESNFLIKANKVNCKQAE